MTEDKIYNILKDIRPVLIILPKMNYAINEIEAYYQFAKANNIEIIDLSSEKYMKILNISLEEDFYDDHHLNYYGSNKISNYLAKYITDNYSNMDIKVSESTKEFLKKDLIRMKDKYAITK